MAVSLVGSCLALLSLLVFGAPEKDSVVLMVDHPLTNQVRAVLAISSSILSHLL
jgi:hypothetical protein